MEPTDDCLTDEELARRLQAEWDDEDQYYLSRGPSEEDEDEGASAPKLPPRPNLPPRPPAQLQEPRRPNRRFPDVPMDATLQIRVLELQPGRREDDIVCTLAVQNLDLSTQPTIPDPKIKSRPEADVEKPEVWEDYRRQCADPPYVALSYTWGDLKPEHQKPISLHGIGNFKVTPNLHDCLRRLRKANETQRLWIDQLWIHQDDLDERAAQVRAMAHIYAQALDVFIWLGDTTTTNDLILPAENDWAYRRAVYDELEQAVNHASSSCWTRAWVTQEFMMARRDPMICFGNCQIRWTRLIAALATILRERGGAGPSSGERFKTLAKAVWREGDKAAVNPIDLLGTKLLNYATMTGPMQTMDFGRESRGLVNYSWTFTHTQAKDPRDKVYSLYGLMTEGEQARTTIDYGKDVATVFAEATYTAIVESQDFAFLRFASSRGRSDPALPSWAVDFASRRGEVKGGDDIIFGDLGRYVFARGKAGKPWCARQNALEPEIRLDNARLTLTFRGLVFDSIHASLAGERRKWEKKPYAKAWMKGAFKAPRDLFSENTTVLTEDEEPVALDPSPPPTTFPENRGESLQILSIRLFTAWYRTYLQTRGHIAPDELKTTWGLHTLWATYLSDLSEKWCVYVTKCGFLGRGHAETREGDVVVLPYGSRQPMLLRRMPGGEEWRFMGFTQVNGLMVGAGVSVLGEVLPDLVLEERDFVLR